MNEHKKPEIPKSIEYEVDRFSERLRYGMESAIGGAQYHLYAYYIENFIEEFKVSACEIYKRGKQDGVIEMGKAHDKTMGAWIGAVLSGDLVPRKKED